MIVHGDTVFVADLSGGVAAIDVATGDRRWEEFPTDDADSSGGASMSWVDGRVRLFVPFSHAAELDASTGEVLSVESAPYANPWPEQAGVDDDDNYGELEGWEPRVRLDPDSYQPQGRTLDGALAFQLTVDGFMDPLPYALRVGSTVIVSDGLGYIVALDWP